MTWILIIFIHASFLSESDSMTMTSVPGFSTQAECQAAGKLTEKLTSGTKKATVFVCVPQKKLP